ncbi:family 78 glycoside hydrolase catalytic domain [Paenibacillus sp. Root444D2]|uniref:family 78 glycoside hydrolase catalytic domain n=1 Tax=Paenibacillus sp. Root444D2 TaxID=1736538 RepID=UPI00070EF1D0|nr:family 78 glycoside hydrolase catalytic domain [Paenibacillus sp. Root444D2]KQX68658.1 alpha-L-rhamnosidase [Paenibacillus sp. Root444D2]
MQLDEMFVESKICPIGVDVTRPAFGWSFKSGLVRSQMQTAYRIVVSTEEDCVQRFIWDSGKMASRKNVHILYEGPLLQSRTRYYWRLQFWDQTDQMTESPVSWWEMGLLKESDWAARWIGEPDGEPQEHASLPLFRYEFNLDKSVERARAYICGLGQYELRLNGNKVSDHVLTPGWTNFDKTCLYCVYDVTDEVKKGANAVGVMLGNGFFNVTGGRYSKFKHSFGTPRCMIQLEITHTDGTIVTIASNQDWETSAGPITFSCIYGGEDFDARRVQAGWDLPGFTEREAWGYVAEVAPPVGKLKSQALSPLKVMQTFKPVSISQPTPGVYVADFGQNFSGWVEISVVGQEGSKITLSPAELLKDDGTANQKWTGSPYRFSYILKGNGEEIWSPRFSYYGFRYVQIEGAIPADSLGRLPTDCPVLVSIEGQMIYPDTRVSGRFESSNVMLNRTQKIINQAILSNMKSLFTDCPHREKLGWLEQVHLMGPAVAFNYQIEPLLTKTMEDIRDAQLPSGMVPTTAPEYVVFSDKWRCFRDSVSWGGAYVLTGWNLFRMYGNTRILAEHYEGMKAYIDYVTESSDHLIVSQGLGDWYDVGENGPGFAQNTPVSHTETAMFYHIVDIFTQIACLLNNNQDAVNYAALREKIKSAFNDAFFERETSSYATGSQTSNAMPLVLGLVDEPYKESVLSQVIEDIRLHGYHTTAGDVGHRYVLLALALNGRSDIIYEMTRQTDHPSYGYQIAHGATTLTEAWDGPTVGKSQNHFMLGHLEEWLYVGLAGIDYRYDPAFESYKVTIKPAIPPGLEEVKAEHWLPVGCLRVVWKRTSHHQLMLNVVMPANCSGIVYVPAISMDTITENGSMIEKANCVEIIGYEAGYAVLRVSSGQYCFNSEI